MPRGDKRKYTDKQKRKAEHIEEGYEKHGVSSKEAERRAWATVNAESGGGEKPGGSGYGKPESHRSSRRGGRVSQARRSRSVRQEAARKAAHKRKRNKQKRSTAARKAAQKRSRG
jgi:hypothetical protein